MNEYIAEVDYSSGQVPTSASAPQSHPVAASHQIPTPTDLQPGQMFGGYPSYPPTAVSTSSVPPSSYHATDSLSRSAGVGPGAGAMTSAPGGGGREPQTTTAGFGTESRKRRIDEVDGRQQEDHPRLGLQFHHHEGSSISPSSYRTYSDFPRSAYPQQVPAPATAGQLRQSALSEEESPTTTISLIKAPMLEDFGNNATTCLSQRVSGRRHLVHGRRRQIPREGHGSSMRICSSWSQPFGVFNMPISSDRSQADQ
jgi:hypothetical protein